MSTNKILLVDDNHGQRITMESILKKSGFAVVSADCGLAALSVVEKCVQEQEELTAALLDIKMPDITGIDVLKELKQVYPNITVIMMTGYAEPDYAIAALNAGATAYVLKPANIEQIKNLLNQAIEHKRLQEENMAMSAALIEWKTKLEKKVEERTGQLKDAHKLLKNLYEELKKNFESTLEVLAIAIDQRDPLTYSHSFRVTQYAQEIGKSMDLSPKELEKLRYAGLLHDLGKIEIHETILTKEGSLTSQEYEMIQSHARGTFEILSKFKFKSSLADIPLIASSHHERYDGGGYPNKLKGDDIPLLARILAVADVLDAITSKRHYRTAMPIDGAIAIIKRETGGHFDPKCTDALFRMNAANFIQVHAADFLEKCEMSQIIELSPYTLMDIFNASVSPEPSEEQKKALQLFYNFYQGPVPERWSDTITPAKDFGESA